MKHHALACSVLLMGVELTCTGGSAALAADYLSLSSFSSDPAAAGWKKAASSATWNSGSGFLDCSSGGWYSPVFTPVAGEYYKVQYDVQLTTSGKRAQFGTFFGNPSATYDLEPTDSPLYRKTSSGSQMVTGQLLADNYTAMQPIGNGWTTITEFSRVPVNATQSFLYFGPDSSGARVDNVRVSSATSAEVLGLADQRYNNPANFPVKLNYTPPANRFASMPKTLGKLTQAKTLKVVVLGDSIMADTQNSGFDAMIERNFAGSNVVVQAAVGHGTGMNDWLNASSFNDWRHNGLKLQQAVYDQQADLVIIGGISNDQTGDRAATLAIVQALKAQGTEVLLTSGYFGNTLDGSKFVANVNGTTVGSDPSLSYRNWMYNLAQSQGVGFFDTYGAWGTHLLALRANGIADSLYYRDEWTHANTAGKEMVGRLYESYFTAVPEPTAISICAVLGAGLLRRTRGSRR